MRARLRATNVGSEFGFDLAGGPVLAVCGLAGGVGTSTLALELARRAAAASRAPVLLSETDSRIGGLAGVTGAESRLSLGGLARAAFGGQRPADAFASVGRLRLIAGPIGSDTGDPDEVEALIAEARGAHGLVVIDGGLLLSRGARLAVGASDAVLLVACTSPGSLRRTGRLLESEPVGAKPFALALVASRGASAPRRALREFAVDGCSRVVLVPRDPALLEGVRAGAALDLPLAAVAGWLRREVARR